jgi:hypothetical protein
MKKTIIIKSTNERARWQHTYYGSGAPMEVVIKKNREKLFLLTADTTSIKWHSFITRPTPKLLKAMETTTEEWIGFLLYFARVSLIAGVMFGILIFINKC